MGIDWPCASSELTTEMAIQITALRISVFLSSRMRHCVFHRHYLLRVLFLRDRVDLCDVSSRKPDNNGASLVGLVRRDKDIRTSRFGVGNRLREIAHFISRHLLAVGIWKVTVSNEGG